MILNFTGELMSVNSLNGAHKSYQSYYYDVDVQENFNKLCHSGSLSEVKRALSTQMIDIEWLGGPVGTTPLMQAALGGNVDVVELLINRGADLDAIGPNGMTPLHWACMGGSAKMVKILLIWGANHREDNQGLTPLHLATTFYPEKNGAKIIQILLASGADLTAKDFLGETVLHLAIIHEKIDLAFVYLDTYIIQLRNAISPLGKNKQNELLAEWINQTTKAIEKMGNFTALHLSAFHMVKTGEQRLVRALLKSGGDPSILDATFCNAINVLDDMIGKKKGDYKEILNLIKPFRIDPKDDHYNMDNIPTTFVV